MRDVLLDILVPIGVLFFGVPIYDYCFNWWWKTLHERGENIKPPTSPMR